MLQWILLEGRAREGLLYYRGGGKSENLGELMLIIQGLSWEFETEGATCYIELALRVPVSIKNLKIRGCQRWCSEFRRVPGTRGTRANSSPALSTCISKESVKWRVCIIGVYSPGLELARVPRVPGTRQNPEHHLWHPRILRFLILTGTRRAHSM